MAGQTFRELYALLYSVARLGVWLAIFAAIFVPIERIFALHSQKIFRKEIAVDLGYYFLNGLPPALVLGPPISLAVLASIISSRAASSGQSPPGRFGLRPAQR